MTSIHQAQSYPTAVTKALLAATAALLAACSSDPPVLMVEIITGHETDAFSQDPKVTRVDITATAAEGDLSLKASAAPGGTFDFGEVPDDRLLTFEAIGVDASGTPVVAGRSTGGILLSAISGGVIPIFAQRLNQWARPPQALVAAHVNGPAVSLGERYLVSTGGAEALTTTGAADTKASEFYDLFSLTGVSGPTLPRAALSAVARTSALLLINDAGATWLDFQSGLYDDISAPTNLTSFADVAGGTTINAPDGRTFVVGATRRSSASKAVLIVNTDGSVDAMDLPAPRKGAAAAWVSNIGLVIAGGSATEPGVVVLGEKATMFYARSFAPDPTEGAGGVTTTNRHLTLIGGTLNGAPAPTRFLDPNCGDADCAPLLKPGADLPSALVDVIAYALDDKRAIAVGNEAPGDGLTRSFLVDLSGLTAVEIPLREPRRGATTTPAPNGTLGLMGGVHEDGTPALSVEMLFPQ